MRDNDELALGDKSFKHTDESVDVRFIEGGVHFIKDAERTRSHHVDGEQQCHGCHCSFAAGEERNALGLFTRRLGRDLDPAIEWVILVHQREISPAAAKQFREHFAKIRPDLREGLGEQSLRGAVDPGNDVEQFAA